MFKKYKRIPISTKAILLSQKIADDVGIFEKIRPFNVNDKIVVRYSSDDKKFYIRDPGEDEFFANIGDYLIVGIGDYYVCKPHVFEKLYEEIK